MAQRTENEETEFKVVPETTTSSITLCVKCGVAALANSTAPNNLCQKCLAPITKSFRSTSSRRSSPERNLKLAVTSLDLKKDEPVKREVNRCSGCRKKVGLTGFRCRCGDLFCADHRYSDRHDCTYDYKTVGRETIARENPVVKAAKIVKI